MKNYKNNRTIQKRGRIYLKESGGEWSTSKKLQQYAPHKFADKTIHSDIEADLFRYINLAPLIYPIINRPGIKCHTTLESYTKKWR